MARRKAQVRYGTCLAARGRLPARHTRFFCALSAFAYLSAGSERYSTFAHSQASAHFAASFALLIGPRFPLPAMAGQSASSWQGLVLVPGGAPMPPECRIAIQPAGAAPRPASRRLMSAPFEWTRWVHDN